MDTSRAYSLNAGNMVSAGGGTKQCKNAETMDTSRFQSDNTQMKTQKPWTPLGLHAYPNNTMCMVFVFWDMWVLSMWNVGYVKSLTAVCMHALCGVR